MEAHSKTEFSYTNNINALGHFDVSCTWSLLMYHVEASAEEK